MELLKKENLSTSDNAELELIEFTLGDQYFGIDVARVEEIMRNVYEVTPMPHANQYVEGVFKQRGTIITIIDLAKYLGLPPSTSIENDILIVTNFDKIKSAFHVHTVKDIHRISLADIEKPDTAIYGGESGVANGIAHFEDRLITILDFEKILRDI
ncbi:MAG: chemotaxis protein CheW [Clostridiales bacterium]|jgi:two-component system chemotaxis response regulator CheV|nr:chemotaxis protein CheW [Clostridiales bacterium]